MSRLSGPAEVVRVYKKLTPRPKDLLMNSNNRRFIREGKIGLWDPKERMTKERYLFLFNDVLLIAKPEPGVYWLKVYVSLRTSLRCEDVPDSVTPYKVEFRVYAPRKTLIFFARSQEEKATWIRDIRSGIGATGGKGEFQATPLDKPSFNPSVNEERDNFATEYTKETFNSSSSSNITRGSTATSVATLGSDIGKIEIPGHSSKRNKSNSIQSNLIDIPDYEEIDVENDSNIAPSGNNFDLLNDEVVDIGNLGPLPMPTHNPNPQLSNTSDNKLLDPYGLSSNTSPPRNQPSQIDPYNLLGDSGNYSSNQNILQPEPFNNNQQNFQQPTQPIQQQQTSPYDALYSVNQNSGGSQLREFYGSQSQQNQNQFSGFGGMYGNLPIGNTQYGNQPQNQLYNSNQPQFQNQNQNQISGGSQLRELYGSQSQQNQNQFSGFGGMYGNLPIGNTQYGNQPQNQLYNSNQPQFQNQYQNQFQYQNQPQFQNSDFQFFNQPNNSNSGYNPNPPYSPGNQNQSSFDNFSFDFSQPQPKPQPPPFPSGDGNDSLI